MKTLGYSTLMCGDGTNDVGALKHADVGVALLANAPLHPPEPPKKVKPVNDVLNHQNDHGPRNRRRGPTSERTNNPRQNMNRNEKMIEAQKQIQKMLEEIEEQDKAQIVKLGDASIAAPFTSKLSSIQCGKHWTYDE